MSNKINYENVADAILSEVGGHTNIQHVAHCATRLRLNLKDDSLANDEKIKNIQGVLGVVRAGGQLQIIIGQDVSKVYDQFTLVHHFQDNHSEDIKPKQAWSLKLVGTKILDALSGSLTPAIPLITVAAFFKMIQALIGPDMLNLVASDSDILVLVTFIGDTAFYFFPVILGYTAARKFKVSPLLGILLGCIMLHPTYVAIAAEGKSFNIFGIPSEVQNYSATILPIIMSVWVMSYVSKFFESKLPTLLRSFLAPALTITVMLPIVFCVLGPIGAIAGTFVSESILNLSGTTGFIGVALIGALFPYLIMTGMHMILITALIQTFLENGSESFVAPGLAAASFAIAGMAFGAALRLKNRDEKVLAWSYFATMMIAGTSEPALYGVGVRYKKPLIGMMSGGFVAGLYFGVLNIGHHTLIPLTNILSLLSFSGYTTFNLVNGIIGCAIAFTVAGVVTFLLGLNENKKDLI